MWIMQHAMHGSRGFRGCAGQQHGLVASERVNPLEESVARHQHLGGQTRGPLHQKIQSILVRGVRGVLLLQVNAHDGGRLAAVVHEDVAEVRVARARQKTSVQVVECRVEQCRVVCEHLLRR